MRRIVKLLMLSIFMVTAPTALVAQDVAGGASPTDNGQGEPAAADATAPDKDANADTGDVARAQDAGDDQTGADDQQGRESHIVVKDQKKKREFSDKIVVLQRKPIIRRLRAEMAPMFVYTSNESLVAQPGVGFDLNFYPLDWMSIGVTGSWLDWRFVNYKSDGINTEEVIDATDAIPNMSVVNAWVGMTVNFTPIYGKIAMFGSSIVNWDLSIGLGGGLISTRAKKFSGGGIIQVTNHMYLLKWFSLNFQVKGLVYYEDIGTHKGVFNHWEAGVGFGFWVPPSWTYKSDF